MFEVVRSRKTERRKVIQLLKTLPVKIESVAHRLWQWATDYINKVEKVRKFLIGDYNIENSY